MKKDLSLWQDEFYDILLVLEMGAKKHGRDNWLKKNGKKSSFKEMHESMFHHLSDSWSQGIEGVMDIDVGYEYRHDFDSKLDSLLLLGTRSLMCYTLLKRGYYKKENL